MIKKTIEYIKIPKRPLLITLGVSALIILGWSIRPQKQVVDVVPVEKGLFQRLLTDEGTTEFKNKYIITAPADGITPRIDWKAGDKVTKGQKILTFFWDYDKPIYSPTDGYILEIYEQDRRHVARGTPILKIGNPNDVEIIAKFLTEVAVEIEVGQAALIDNWGGEQTLNGVVKKIEPAAHEEVSALGVKEQRVNVVIEITSPRDIWEKLGDGYRVDVSIITDTKDNATLLPIGALFESDQGPSVYVAQNNTALLKPIQTGQKNRKYIDVLGGLKPDDQVILYPDNSIKNGTKIKIRTQ